MGEGSQGPPETRPRTPVSFRDMKALAAASVLVALTLGLSAWVGSDRAGVARAAGLPLWPPTEQSSRLLLGGRVRCSVTVQPQVKVGHAVRVAFTLRNVSKHSVTVHLWVFSSTFTLNAADGTTYDATAPYRAFPGIPPPRPRKLRRGATLHLASQPVKVRWTGPLRIAPRCLGRPLPALHVRVVAPWPRPAESAAVGEVVAAAGHLLDNCLPQTPGVPVDGQIYPPSGSAPPMDAQCSVSLTWDGDFLQAQALVLVPPDLAGVQVFQPYETLWPIDEFLPLAASPPYEAVAWEFVVTRYRAIPVAASTLAATSQSSGTVPGWAWNGAGFASAGGFTCGGTTFAGGGTGPALDFVTACQG